MHVMIFPSRYLKEVQSLLEVMSVHSVTETGYLTQPLGRGDALTLRVTHNHCISDIDGWPFLSSQPLAG